MKPNLLMIALIVLLTGCEQPTPVILQCKPIPELCQSGKEWLKRCNAREPAPICYGIWTKAIGDRREQESQGN